jgi:hypothetical protein
MRPAAKSTPGADGFCGDKVTRRHACPDTGFRWRRGHGAGKRPDRGSLVLFLILVTDSSPALLAAARRDRQWAGCRDVGASHRADAGELILLLDTLRDADIAAYAARLDRSGRRRPRSAFRIWVDTWTHARAEDVIREALLRHRRADR